MDLSSDSISSHSSSSSKKRSSDSEIDSLSPPVKIPSLIDHHEEKEKEEKMELDGKELIINTDSNNNNDNNNGNKDNNSNNNKSSLSEEKENNSAVRPSPISSGVLSYTNANHKSLSYFINDSNGVIALLDRLFRYRIMDDYHEGKGIEDEGKGKRGERNGPNIELLFMEEKSLHEEAQKELSYQNGTIAQLKEALERSNKELSEKRELVRLWRKNPSIKPKDDDNNNLMNDLAALMIENDRIADEIKEKEEQQGFIVTTDRIEYRLIIPPYQFIRWRDNELYWLPDQEDLPTLSSNNIVQLSIPIPHSIPITKTKINNSSSASAARNSRGKKFSFDQSFNSDGYHLSFNPLSIVDYKEGDAIFNDNYTRITANRPLFILTLQSIPFTGSSDYYYWKFIVGSNSSGYFKWGVTSTPFRTKEEGGWKEADANVNA